MGEHFTKTAREPGLQKSPLVQRTLYYCFKSRNRFLQFKIKVVKEHVGEAAKWRLIIYEQQQK